MTLPTLKELSKAIEQLESMKRYEYAYMEANATGLSILQINKSEDML